MIKLLVGDLLIVIFSATVAGQVQVCSPNIKRCLGDTLQECNSTGLNWFNLKICTGGCDNISLSCNLEAGQICGPYEPRCAGNMLQICAADGMIWKDVENCSYGCDNRACLGQVQQTQAIPGI